MRRGQITVFLALLLPMVLALLGATMESAYQQVVRSKIERGLILCESAVLSEYQVDLWEQYGLFYLDTAYGGKTENIDVLKARMLGYLNGNEVDVSALEVNAFSRMTDENGLYFYEQAVSYIKSTRGADLLDRWMGCVETAKNLTAWEEDYVIAEARERKNLEVLRERRLAEEKMETEDPTEVVRVTGSRLLSYIFGDLAQLSIKAVTLSESPSNRSLLVGSGVTGANPANIVNDQWFYTYLLEHFTNAADCIREKTEGGPFISYEIEYLIAGRDNDMENLKAVMNRLILLRCGANYLYLVADAEKVQQAYSLAAVIAGITFMPELIEAIQQVILLVWAYGESVSDVRRLLSGSQVDLVKTKETWKLSLTQLFLLRDSLQRYEEESDTNGMSYAGYLRILLTLMGRKMQCMRALDVIEGNLRVTELGRQIYLDQCIDGFHVAICVPDKKRFGGMTGWEEREGSAFYAERRFEYEWR